MASLPDPVYNVGGDNVLSIRELAHRVVEVARRDYGRAVELEVPSHSSQSPPPWVPFRCDPIKGLGYRPQERTAEAIRALFSLLGWK
jgi:nucleoside-diphosphate-sugar epimerase